MEQNINIAEILKDKPKGTKLYSPLYGDVFLQYIGEMFIIVKYYGITDKFYYNGKLYSYDESEPLLFPSKEMRDWNKFAWKKGDVLSCGVDHLCIFEKWNNDHYTEFDAKFVTPNYSSAILKTEDWTKVTNEVIIKQYISNIEEFKGGKLNLSTLEIQKQPEFKGGDVEKKQIVDLPKKCKFKPMDWCLMRFRHRVWHLCQFAFISKSLLDSPVAIGGNIYDECIPYNEDTKHLLGTTDEWKGSEG